MGCRYQYILTSGIFQIGENLPELVLWFSVFESHSSLDALLNSFEVLPFGAFPLSSGSRLASKVHIFVEVS
jgi:hypothetical protein